AKNDRFVAIADRKMCAASCRAPFVHGLVLPRLAPITGIEDVRKATPPELEGLWTFAWDVAGTIPDLGDDAAFVINPRGARSLNHLHVHIVRRSTALSAFVDLPDQRVVVVDDREAIWSAAREAARRGGFGDWGLLVTRDAGGRYVVVAVRQPNAIMSGDRTGGNPERLYTLAECR